MQRKNVGINIVEVLYLENMGVAFGILFIHEISLVVSKRQ